MIIKKKYILSAITLKKLYDLGTGLNLLRLDNLL